MSLARRHVILVAVLAVAALAALPGAEAAFSGTNGLIAYTCGTNVCKVAADGSSQGTMVTGATQPAWASGGARIAYVTSSGISVANVDANGTVTGATPLSTGSAVAQPTWSPDGSKLVYVNTTDHHIYSILVSGSGSATDLTPGATGSDTGP